MIVLYALTAVYTACALYIVARTAWEFYRATWGEDDIRKTVRYRAPEEPLP